MCLVAYIYIVVYIVCISQKMVMIVLIVALIKADVYWYVGVMFDVFSIDAVTSHSFN
jgi:hypothetical protein